MRFDNGQDMRFCHEITTFVLCLGQSESTAGHNTRTSGGAGVGDGNGVGLAMDTSALFVQ